MRARGGGYNLSARTTLPASSPQAASPEAVCASGVTLDGGGGLDHDSGMSVQAERQRRWYANLTPEQREARRESQCYSGMTDERCLLTRMRRARYGRALTRANRAEALDALGSRVV